MIDIPSLESWRREADGLQAAYLRCAAAIACADGRVTIAELAALGELARDVAGPDDAAVSANLVMRAIDAGPPKPDQALKDLAQAAKPAPLEQRRALFSLAVPLLATQGQDARSLAQALAKALDVRLADQDLERLDLPAAAKGGLLASLRTSARQILGTATARDQLLAHIARSGDRQLAAAVERIQSLTDSTAADELAASTARQLIERLEADIGAYRDRMIILDQAEQIAGNLVDAAAATRRQIEERLAVIERRIAMEKAELEEDIAALIDGIGNEIAAAMHERFTTDDWRSEAAWENFARTQAGRAIELRIEKLRRRHDQHIDLFRDELARFTDEMRTARAEVIKPIASRDVVAIVPPLSLGSRVMNAADRTVHAALVSSALAGAGAGGLVLGGIVAAPVVLPLAAGVGAVLAVGGLYKFITDPKGRKARELADRRAAVEDGLAQMLGEVAGAQAAILDDVLEGFRSAARGMLMPLLLNAEAARDLQALRRPMAERAIADTQQRIREIAQLIPAAHR